MKSTGRGSTDKASWHSAPAASIVECARRRALIVAESAGSSDAGRPRHAFRHQKTCTGGQLSPLPHGPSLSTPYLCRCGIKKMNVQRPRWTTRRRQEVATDDDLLVRVAGGIPIDADINSGDFSFLYALLIVLVVRHERMFVDEQCTSNLSEAPISLGQVVTVTNPLKLFIARAFRHEHWKKITLMSLVAIRVMTRPST